MSKIYDDELTLAEMYWGNGMSQEEIANELGCSKKTISKYMNKHGIDVRAKNQQYRKPSFEELERWYWFEGLTTEGIAEKLGVSQAQVQRWMVDRDVPREKYGKAAVHPCFQTTRSGYEMVLNCHRGEYYQTSIHRLTAVAEYGFDAVVDKHVHHKNGIQWDNRPCNLEPLTAEEHMRHHAIERGFGKND